MKAQTHRRNIPSDYSLVQRPIKSPNLPSGGRDYLEISGEKEINLQTALERLRCTQDSQPFKGQLKAATWPLWVLGCDTVPKAPASPQLCPPPIQSNAVCFHLHFLSSWVWKLINSQWKIQGVPATPGKWLDLATHAHTPRSTINWRRVTPPLQGTRLPSWLPCSPEPHSSSPALHTAPQDCPPPVACNPNKTLREHVLATTT